MIQEIKGLNRVDKHRARHMRNVMLLGMNFIPERYELIRNEIQYGLFTHDIGYSHPMLKDKLMHNELGCEILSEHGTVIERYMALVHCKAFNELRAGKGFKELIDELEMRYKEYPELPRDLWLIVSLADLSVSRNGDIVSIGERLDEIGKRLGRSSDSYLQSLLTYISISRDYKDTEVYMLFRKVMEGRRYKCKEEEIGTGQIKT